MPDGPHTRSVPAGLWVLYPCRCTPAAGAIAHALHTRLLPCLQAVRLFAELKDRGEDTPEVHSALVEAFCR